MQRGWQWDNNLIGYYGLTSYGAPSYHLQKMFGNYLGNSIVNMSGDNIPTHMRPANRRDSTTNIVPKPVPSIYYVASKDSKTGAV